MRREFLKSAAAIAAGVATFGLAGAASAQDAAEFYDGNVIKWIVPYDPGGGYDEYTRVILPYFEKYSGARVDIINMPGSGGMKGAVEIFNSPADGTYIGIVNGSALVTNQLAEIAGADYKLSEYSWIGRIVADPRVFVAAANSGIESFEGLQGDGETAIVGATGLGGSTYVDAVIIGEAFGIDQRVIHGFDRSGDIRTAMLRGDVDAMWGSLGSALDGIASGDHEIILHAERDSDLPELQGKPNIFELAAELEDSERAMRILEAWEGLSAVGRPVVGPPGVPEDRLAFLRDALEQAIMDPEFRAQSEEAGRDLSYASGEDMQRIARSATELDDDLMELFVAAIRGEI